MFDCFKKRKPKIKDLPILKPVKLPPHYLEAALYITGSFEGTGYGQVSGNFDGQGISVGILQWNYGQGSLQNKILKPLIDEFGTESIDEMFPLPISETAYMNPKEAIKFAKLHMLKKNILEAEWKRSWRVFLSSQPVKAQQRKAAGSIAEAAWNLCLKHGMTTKKSFCWFFDVITQNGSLKGVEKPATSLEYSEHLFKDGGVNQKLWKISSPNDESRTLYVWICRRVTRNRWASDVISRKGTIAHGVGRVHGKEYNFTALFNEVENGNQ